MFFYHFIYIAANFNRRHMSTIIIISLSLSIFVHIWSKNENKNGIWKLTTHLETYLEIEIFSSLLRTEPDHAILIVVSINSGNGLLPNDSKRFTCQNCLSSRSCNSIHQRQIHRNAPYFNDLSVLILHIQYRIIISCKQSITFPFVTCTITLPLTNVLIASVPKWQA